MRKSWHKTTIRALLLAFLILHGCGGTDVKSVWKKSDFNGGPYQNVLVVGITKVQGNKHIWEDTMAAKLRQYGIKATPSANAFPGDTDITKAEILDYVQQKAIDAVLITRLINIVEEKYYKADGGVYGGTFYGETRYRYYNDFGSYYDSAYRPGKTTTSTTVILETNLYDTASQQLVWSMSTDTFDPVNTGKLVEGVSEKVINKLQDDNLIGQTR